MTHADIGAAYDARAEEYVNRFGRVDSSASTDRDLITRWRDATPGLVLDVGCGPAHWTRWLDDAHHTVLGLDASSRFLAHARGQDPRTSLLRASIDALPVRTSSVDGILAWYSIIHTPPAALPAVFAEFRRVLRPEGTVLIGVVDGLAAEPFTHAVLEAYSWSVEALEPMLASAGLDVTERHRRHDVGHRPHAALMVRSLAAPSEVPAEEPPPA